MQVEIGVDGTVRSWPDDPRSPADVTVSAIAQDFEPAAVAAERDWIERECARQEQRQQ